jgi:hypothetical protein
MITLLNRKSEDFIEFEKNLDHSAWFRKKTTLDYQEEFRKITMEMTMVNSYEDG